MADKSTLYCSFCGKSQHEVRKLIAGPTAFICSDCIDLCARIVSEPSVKRESAFLAFTARADRAKSHKPLRLKVA